MSYTDLYFFEAVSRGLAEFGPAQSILMTGGSLRYHWFSYAWAGELAQTSSAVPFATITRVLPLVTLVGVSMLVAAWAARLSRIRWVPTLAVLLVVAGGYAGALYGSVLNFDSPSQSMTTLWLLALLLAFVLVVEGTTSRVAGLVTVAALAAACTGRQGQPCGRGSRRHRSRRAGRPRDARSLVAARGRRGRHRRRRHGARPTRGCCGASPSTATSPRSSR